MRWLRTLVRIDNIIVIVTVSRYMGDGYAVWDERCLIGLSHRLFVVLLLSAGCPCVWADAVVTSAIRLQHDYGTYGTTVRALCKKR